MRTNVLSLLTPKFHLAWIRERARVRQALDRLDDSGQAMLPILDAEGHYVGVFAFEDVRHALALEPGLTLADLAERPLMALARTTSFACIRASASTRQLGATLGAHAGLVVLDDRHAFIGVVDRATLLAHALDEGAAPDLVEHADPRATWSWPPCLGEPAGVSWIEHPAPRHH